MSLTKELVTGAALIGLVSVGVALIGLVSTAVADTFETQESAAVATVERSRADSNVFDLVGEASPAMDSDIGAGSIVFPGMAAVSTGIL